MDADDCGFAHHCHYYSYGSYDIDGHHETNVQVASDRSTPARGPQTILVDPVHPRTVVNKTESRTSFLVLGAFMLLAGCALPVQIIFVRRRVNRRNDALLSGDVP